MPMWKAYDLPSLGPREIRPEAIAVRSVPVDDLARIQPKMSKAIWRPAPGRKVGYIVEHDDDLIGLLFFASPVINLGVRDEYLQLPADPSKKGRELRRYMDVSVCVSVQPLGWYWNLGKMLALLAPTLGDTLAYDEPLVGLTTTSLWGRGSQYNRIWKFLGYTKGYGHEHISDEEYRAMMREMLRLGESIPSSRFGAGSNPRMRRIMAYRRATGDRSVGVFHGNKRGVYYHEATDPTKRGDVLQDWYERWGRPRWERKRDEEPPYRNGLE